MMGVLLRVKNSWMKQCTFLRGSILEYFVVAVIYAIVTIVLTNGVLLHIGTQLFTGGSGDATAGFLWLNYADPGINPILSHTNLVNYPAGEDLGGPTFITYIALWLPLRILSYLFGPVAGLNLMMLLGFLLAGMSGYWLIKRLTGSKLIAFFAGYAIAFVPYNLYKSVSHLAYLYCFPFVLIFAGFIGVWRKPTKLRAVLLGGVIALAFYTDGYYLLIGSVTIACLLMSAALLTIINKSERPLFGARLRMFGLAAATLIVLSIPIIYVQASQGSKVSALLSSSRASDPASEMRAYRARWGDFLLPSKDHPILSHNASFETVSWYKELRSTPSECMNYIGYAVLGLDVIGIILLVVYVVRRRHSSLSEISVQSRKQLMFFGAVLLVSTPIFLAFMFSPATEFLHHTIYLPGQIMAHFGIGFWRVLARFFIPLHILLVIFAALTLSIIYRLVAARPGKRIVAVAIVLGVTALTGFEYLTTYNTPSFDFTKMPAGYTWLKNQHDIKVVAELPMVDALDGKTGYYVTAQIVHGKDLVNMKEPSQDRLNNAIGGIDNPETINLAYKRGAQAIITHDIECRGAVIWGTLIYRGNSKNNDPLCIYRLERPVDNDDDFVVFGQGFQYTPVRQQPYEQSIAIDSGSADFHIVNKTLRSSAPDKTVSFTGTITYMSDKLLSGTWMLEQGGRVLCGGILEGSQTKLVVEGIDTSLPARLKISYGNGVPVHDITTSLIDSYVR